MNIEEIFTKDVILHLKNNKHLITEELLEEMRMHGNEGKHLALEILDLDKDNEQYYLDAFGNRISQNGNRSLKKPFTQLPISEIHKKEIEKCAEDIHYFKDNYVKMMTNNGNNFINTRVYQNDFIDVLNSDDDSIIGLMGRQSGKSSTVSIYLSHLYCFNTEKNIGIVANKGAMAREFLNNVKNILIGLPIWMMPGMKTWNKSFIEAENGMRIMTDVPGANAFRGFSIHCAIIDEAGFISPNLWNEFIDAFLPSQSALSWKKNCIISTPQGMNHYYNLVKGASPDFETDGSGVKSPGKNHNGYTLFKVDWKDVPRYNNKGEVIKPEDFKQYVINKHGIMYWLQNYECAFHGSSATLISTEKIKSFEQKNPELILDNKLKVYNKPIKGHQYIMSVDPAKDGRDAFAVQVIDITNFEFKQVASAKLQIDYLLMPAFIDEWCRYYYNPYLIIENNEGAGQSIADQMYQTYEYENLHFDKSTETNKRKKYPGTRTTPKSRKQILQTMKTFIENNNLEINDEDTIKEFFTFILINEKYQADESCHDDMVMALALAFTLFNRTKNFEDMKQITDLLFTEMEERDEVNMLEIITVGGFDDGVYENDTFEEDKEIYYDTIEDYLLSGELM